MRHYLSKHRKLVFFVLLLQVIVSVTDVCINLLMMEMFQGIIDLDIRRFLQGLLYLGCAWLITILFDAIRVYFQKRAIRSLNNSYRNDLAASLLQKDYSAYHKLSAGEYLSWFTNDTNQLESLAWEPFFSVIEYSSNVLFCAIALFMLHWSLLAAAGITAVVMLLAPRLFSRRMSRLGEEMSLRQAEGTDAMKEVLSGLDVLRFFRRCALFREKIRTSSDRIETARFRLGYIKEFVGAGVNVVNLVCQTSINFLIGYLSIRGFMIQSALFGGGNICGMFSNGLNQIARNSLSFSAAKPFFEKITVHSDGIFADENVVSDPAEMLPPLHESICISGVTFSYHETPVLSNVSLCFQKGGKYALTGPSGCGKSTLLKLILGWLPDYSGSITYDAKDIRMYSSEALQSQMSYIEQDIFLFNTTIRDNITLGETFSDEELALAIENSALRKDLEHMPNGIDTIVGEDGSSLSGGQKQRVAIARALIHNRSILLVDEGTSALDHENAAMIEDSLLSNPDLTLILVSHHLSSESERRFTEVIHMAPATGQSAANTSPAQLVC